MKALGRHIDRWSEVYLCLTIVAYLMWVAAVIS